MIVSGFMKVNNMPAYREKYLVVTLVDGELWFYGMYADKSRAEVAAAESDNRFIMEVDNDR